MSNKIENRADVLEWAQTIVEGNGEKFTVLSKGEQYVIAKAILDMTTKEETPDAKPVMEVAEVIPAKGGVMTRAEAFHREGFDAQKVFDKFLDWCKDHPQDREVMDFSNGKKSTDAAFAYWLAGIG